ncbi:MULTISPECIES: hypothetical protein, partial [unclassified Pseudomonas]
LLYFFYVIVCPSFAWAHVTRSERLTCPIKLGLSQLLSSRRSWPLDKVELAAAWLETHHFQ